MPNKHNGLQYLTAAKADAYKGYFISSDENDDDFVDNDTSFQMEKNTNNKKPAEIAAKMKKASQKSSPRSKKTTKTSSKDTLEDTEEEKEIEKYISGVSVDEEEQQGNNFKNLREDLKNWTKKMVPGFEPSKEETENILNGKFKL